MSIDVLARQRLQNQQMDQPTFTNHFVAATDVRWMLELLGSPGLQVFDLTTTTA